MKYLFAFIVLLIVALTRWLGFWMALATVVGGLVGLVLLISLVGLLRPQKAGSKGSESGTEVESAADADACSSDEATPLQPAIDAHLQQHHALAIELAAPFLDDPLPAIRADALRLTAFGYTHRERYAEGLPFLKALAEVEPSVNNRLSIASTEAMLGQVDAAEAAYHEVERQRTVEAGGDPDQRTVLDGRQQVNFLSSLDQGGHPERAFHYLKALADMYCSLHITDSNFLYMRTMPFFSTFLENSLPLVRKVLDDEALTAWYRTIHDAVDEPGKALFEHYGVPH